MCDFLSYAKFNTQTALRFRILVKPYYLRQINTKYPS